MTAKEYFNKMWRFFDNHTGDGESILLSKASEQRGIDILQEYADQETERLKAELVKTIETAKATSVTQRQHIERLQNEVAEKDIELKKWTDLFKKYFGNNFEPCVENMENKIEKLQSELNELKEKHKIAMDLVDKVKNYQINKVTANELYKLADKILQKNP